jgi:hypothetical protein
MAPQKVIRVGSVSPGQKNNTNSYTGTGVIESEAIVKDKLK